MEAAWFALRSRTSPLRAFYDRVVPRLGKRRAIVAVARKLLVAAWRVWRERRLADEVDPRRYQKELSAIRITIRTLPPYPLAERLAFWTQAPRDDAPPAPADAPLSA